MHPFYHKETTMKRVYDFLKEAKVYYLATTDGNQARVRPFGTINLFEGRLYIMTKNHKKVSDQMKANPKVEISAMAEGKWIRLEAIAVLDERIEAQEHIRARGAFALCHMVSDYHECAAITACGSPRSIG